MKRQGKKAGFGKMITQNKGLSLAELLVATFVLVLGVGGILISYVRCLELNDLAKNTALALKEASSQMEQVKSTAFAQIKTNHNLRTFTVPGITTSRGVIYVDDADQSLLAVTISVSFKQRNGRICGEDKNFNGQADVGEHTSGNGILDSPVSLSTRIFRR